MHTQDATIASPLTEAPPPDSLHSNLEFLSFRVGGEEYGIDILKVQEIRGYEQPTHMTGTASFIKGVMSLRGVIVPVLDLRLKLGVPEPIYDALTVTVVLALSHAVIGIVVDSVSDVVHLTPDQIKRVPDFNRQIEPGCIRGIGSLEHSDQKRMLILLDIEKFMSNSGMRTNRAHFQ